MARLERSNIEFYAAIGLCLFLASVAMSWPLKAFAFLAIAVLASDIICRSPWTHSWRKKTKFIGAGLTLVLIFAFAYPLVVDQYREDHRPLLEIEPGATLDPSDPMETRFVATNRYSFDILQVHYSCFWKPKASKVTSQDLDTDIYPSIKPTGRLSMYCKAPGMTLNGDSALLAIIVMYKLSASGKEIDYRWFPEAANMNTSEVLDFLKSANF